MKTIGQALIYSNSWVALCFASLVFGISSHYRLSCTNTYALFSFFGTISAYQLHRLLRLRQPGFAIASSPRISWTVRNKRWQLIFFYCATTATTVLFFMLPWNTPSLLLIGITGSIIGLYTFPLPLLPFGIRTLPALKILFISSCWTALSALPFLLEHRSIPVPVMGTVFLATIAQIIPFDIRDLSYDHPSMRTIPQLIGTTVARITGFGILLTALCLQTQILGFHWLLLLLLFCGILGHFLSFKAQHQLPLEFLWEIPLGLMGWWFWIA